MREKNAIIEQERRREADGRDSDKRERKSDKDPASKGGRKKKEKSSFY
ncbi:hypothetical protein [Oribacterium sp. oral taxon 078]|nr:hypothetical protein [Oribacterium sp. oral taxon 078]